VSVRGRRGWVLLLLAAVFTMHGLPCAAADSGGPSGAHDTIHAIGAAGPHPVLHLVATGAAMASDHTTASPLAAAVTVATIGMPLGADHDSTPHGSGHLRAWCLAVLAAGLAVLLLALVGRSPGTRLPLPLRAIGRAWGWQSPPRPPDLNSLCLMRI
jgi:hypothetical protein